MFEPESFNYEFHQSNPTTFRPKTSFHKLTTTPNPKPHPQIHQSQKRNTRIQQDRTEQKKDKFEGMVEVSSRPVHAYTFDAKKLFDTPDTPINRSWKSFNDRKIPLKQPKDLLVNTSTTPASLPPPPLTFFQPGVVKQQSIRKMDKSKLEKVLLSLNDSF